MHNPVTRLRAKLRKGCPIDRDVGTPASAKLLEGLRVACHQSQQSVSTIILLPDTNRATVEEAFKARGVHHAVRDKLTEGWFENQFRLHCGCVVNVLSTEALNLN